MKIRPKKICFLLLAVIFLFFLISQPSGAQSNDSDAIAVRVVPNLNHFSISRWYESQGFQGSPQALTVDGYEAIRDGRTIYVNAAEVDQNSKNIYSNIYLISYNQNPAPYTVDILGQIISHWKFNNNLGQDPNAVSNCAISSAICSANSDCGAGQSCLTSGIASGTCALVTPKNCSDDADCSAPFFCNSLKSKITRDLKRLGQLEDIKEALYNYKKSSGSYPVLSAGTYLSNRSVSVWPSWSEVLLSDLAVSQNFLDPINRLGVCLGYDPKTCWNKDTHKFVSEPTANGLTLPAGSYALAYSTNGNGSIYKLCATLESRALGYHFNSNDPSGDPACTVETGVVSGGQTTNTPPQLAEKSLSGQAGREFNGFVRAFDKENNLLTWSLDTSGTNWSGWKNGGKVGRPPILKDTSNPYQKKIYAESAPSLSGSKTYNIKLNISDGEGGNFATTTAITISSSLPVIEAADEEYVLDPISPLSYSFFMSGDNITGPNFSILRTSPVTGYHVLSTMSKTTAVDGANRYKITYHGLVPTTNKFYQDSSYKYRISVTDRYLNKVTKEFTIKVKVDNPYLNFECPESARINERYDCLLGKIAQGNHTLTYSASGLPTGFSVNRVNTDDVSLRGIASTTGSYQVTVKATNEYGASSTKKIILKTNNYCGDGKKQSPNTEGRGGKYNDGYEDCDGAEGVTASSTLSNIDLQYACQTGRGATTTNPILTNDQCVFKSPLNGGGYCGDGYCQVKIGGQPMENCLNCQQDCGNCQVTVQSYSNKEQIAYFNGSRIYKTVWPASGAPTIGQATRSAVTGENIIGFWIHSLSASIGNYGLAYRILIGPTSTPLRTIETTDSITTLRCAAANPTTYAFNGGVSGSDYDPANELINSGFKWPDLNFRETSDFSSSTILASSLSPFHTPYVWGSSPFASSSAFYCRLSYDYSPDSQCHPNCAGQPAGHPDGCGGLCQACTKNCTGKHDNDPDGCGGLCCIPNCTGVCANEIESHCGTVCPDTGYNNQCPNGQNPDCSIFKGLTWSGQAVCQPGCTGYDYSGCQCHPDCTGKCNHDNDGCNGTCVHDDVCQRTYSADCTEYMNNIVGEPGTWKQDPPDGTPVKCSDDCSGYTNVRCVRSE